MEYVKTEIISIITGCFLQLVLAQRFEPRLDVTGCTQSKLKLVIHGAADGGIVYIQGPSPTCRQYTQASVSEHVFDARTCALNWSQTFRIVVQRHPLYLTGEDKRFPVTCIPDTSDLIVGNRLVNVNVLDKAEEEGIIKTVIPTATMYLYRDGVDVNGKTVQLTDELTMVVQLDNDLADDFDILATECYADNIQIIQAGCPVDESLFPKFIHVVQGKLQTRFGVFRPTKLDGGTVNMEFTCTLQVFLGQHIPTVCNGNVGIEANKRKLQSTNKAVDRIVVGNSVLVNTENISTRSLFASDLTVCKREVVYVCIIILLTMISLLTLIGCLCIHRKLKAERRLRFYQKNELERHIMSRTV